MATAPKLRYIYFRSAVSPNHRVVAAGFTFVEGKVYCQIARCHEPDLFCKRIARDIIAGRITKYGPAFTFEVADESRVYETLEKHFHPDTGSEWDKDGKA